MTTHVRKNRMQKCKLKLSLYIKCGDFDPDVITKKLQVEPTKIGRAQRNPKRVNFWSLDTSEDVGINVKDHFNILFSSFNLRKLKLVTRKHETWLSIVSTVDKDFPMLALSPEDLFFIGDFNIGLDIDFYSV